MKADISLAERRRIEREQQAEIRAMLAPRHFAAMQEQMAIDAIMFHLEVEQFRRAAPAINAILAGMEHPFAAGTAPAPVVMPEPEPAPPPAPVPVAVRPGAPDLPFDLRFHLGLR